MTAIFLVSGSSSPPDLPGGLVDVNAHGVTYAVLGALLVRALADGVWRGVGPATACSAVLLASIYGLTDEWHQSFVPARTPEMRDLVADTIGAAAGAGLVWAWSIVVTRGCCDRF